MFVLREDATVDDVTELLSSTKMVVDETDKVCMLLTIGKLTGRFTVYIVEWYDCSDACCI